MSDNFVDPNVSTPASATPEAPAPATPSAPVSAPQTTPVVQPQPPATGGEHATVPSYRLRQIREQYEQKLAQQENQWKSQFETVQKQLHSLVGVTPPANPEVDQIKQQFASLYGDSLAKLTDPQVVQKLLSVIEKAGDLEAQNQHYWTTYGRQTLDRLFTNASETLGAPLTDGGKRQLHAAFVGYLNNDPEAQERYASDPSIVDEFWKAFSSNLIDPVRRSSTAQTIERVPQGLPLDAPSGAPRATPAPQPANLDERVNMAWTQFNKAIKG
jgi:hypothetical protein